MKRIIFFGLTLVFFSLELYAQSFSGGDGTKTNPYKIATEKDLRTLAKEINNEKNNQTYKGKYFLQTADITFSNEPIEPIGGPSYETYAMPENQTFQGCYDGGMHKIYNLNLYNHRQLEQGTETCINVGLFGSLGKGAVVKNIVIASGHIYGFYAVGALAGSICSEVKISRCKIGPNVRIHSWSVGGGLVGGSSGQGMSIIECANYASVNVYGEGMHKSAGGIIGSTANARVEGCANFGDVWGKGGFCGGIIGYQPLSNENVSFLYPEMKSCMNAGDVTSMEACSSGLIGVIGYNLQEGEGKPIPHTSISNSYSYGQSWACFSPAYGPVVALFLKNFPVKVRNTYYDKNRYVMKVNNQKPDQEIAFTLGESVEHAKIISDEFIEKLNQGASYLFEKDTHNMNRKMPVLKWINDTYDKEIDNPNQYRTDLQPSLYTKRAGTFFNPNRRGEFLIWNLDMLQPDVQAKSIGCSIDKGWIERIMAVKGGKTQMFFMSSSDLRRKVGADGAYEGKLSDLSVNHWLITPSFLVDDNNSKFFWEAASEDKDYLHGYKVYVSTNENATTPENFKDAECVYETDAEPTKKVFREQIGDEEWEYYEFNDHEIDLSKYKGKKIRIAFQDNTSQRFNLLIGKFETNATRSSKQIALPTSQIQVENNIIKASVSSARIRLYNTLGILLCDVNNYLQYEAQKGVYILQITDAYGNNSSRKIMVH